MKARMCSVHSGPARDTWTASGLPVVNTKAMHLHLAAISATVATGAPAIILMDRADWQPNTKLAVPENLSIVCIPPATPELNRAENVWQSLRQTDLGNRIFRDYEDIVGRLCEAWRALLNEPERIHSITHRDWAFIDQ